MPAFPGHLRAASITRAPALALLLHHYDMYEPVKASARDVQGAITGLPPTLRGWHRVAEVRRRVESFARRWNLDRIPDLQEASYARIRTALKQLDRPMGASTRTLFEPYSSVQYEPESPRIVAGGHAWTWHLARGETLAQFRQRIMEDLQVSKPSGLAPDVIAGLAAMPDRSRDAGWTLEDTRHGVEQHAAWLFLRLCPQPGPKWHRTWPG